MLKKKSIVKIFIKFLFFIGLMNNFFSDDILLSKSKIEENLKQEQGNKVDSTTNDKLKNGFAFSFIGALLIGFPVYLYQNKKMKKLEDQLKLTEGEKITLKKKESELKDKLLKDDIDSEKIEESLDKIKTTVDSQVIDSSTAQLKEDNEELKEANTNLLEKNKLLKKELEKKSDVNTGGAEGMGNSNKKLKELQEELKKLQEELKELQEELKKANTNLQEKNEELKKELGKKSDVNTGGAEGMDDSNKKLKELQEELKELQKELDKSQLEKNQLVTKLSEANQQSSGSNITENTVVLLNKSRLEKSQLTTELATANQEIKKNDCSIKKLKEQLVEKDQLVTKLKKEKDEKKEAYNLDVQVFKARISQLQFEKENLDEKLKKLQELENELKNISSKDEEIQLLTEKNEDELKKMDIGKFLETIKKPFALLNKTILPNLSQTRDTLASNNKIQTLFKKDEEAIKKMNICEFLKTIEQQITLFNNIANSQMIQNEANAEKKDLKEIEMSEFFTNFTENIMKVLTNLVETRDTLVSNDAIRKLLKTDEEKIKEMDIVDLLIQVSDKLQKIEKLRLDKLINCTEIQKRFYRDCHKGNSGDLSEDDLDNLAEELKGKPINTILKILIKILNDISKSRDKLQKIKWQLLYMEAVPATWKALGI